MSKGMRTSILLIAILFLSLNFVYAECVPDEKLSDSKTFSDVKFSTISTSLNQETSEYIQTIQILNKANSVKNVEYTKYSCRCQKIIGNGDNKICIAYWPQDLFNCVGITDSISLEPKETKTIEISVSSYREKLCGAYQTDLWVNSVNGKNINNLGPWALLHLCEDCQETCEQEQTCLIADNSNSVKDVFLGEDNNAKDLQQVLDDYGLGLNAMLDQKNYQIWDMNNKKQVTLKIDYLFGNSAFNNVVGYYLDNNIFVPLNDLKTLGTQTITIEDTDKLGFAVKNLEKSLILRTENIKNPAGEPFAVVYDACEGWVIGFEDKPDQNYDYQDAVIQVKVLGCEDKCIPSEEVCDGVDNNCNDLIDENISNIITDVFGFDSVGICQEQIESCINGSFQIVQEAIGPEEEVCNGIDDNCNELIDDGVEDIILGEEIGECSQEIQRCINGTFRIIQNQTFPRDEICDSLDNDCDDLIDEDLLGNETSCGIGECLNDGELECIDGNWIDNCEPLEGSDETCDNLDNNCNNLTDENLTQECSNECFQGLEICSLGNWLECNAEPEPFGYGTECFNGTGECRNSGTIDCTGKCNAIPLDPQEEICDIEGLDEDCDGQVNEDCECFDNDDCANLTREYCSQDIHMRDQGVCVDYKCEIDSSEVEDCGVKDGLNNECGMFDWSCSEELNRVDCVITNIIADDSLCSDESSCNGQETCNNITFRCESSEEIDCSVFNIPGIDTCDNNPDNNPFTFDFREEFTSQCIELGNNEFKCTTGNENITHECSELCGAECLINSDCSDLTICASTNNKTYVNKICDSCSCEKTGSPTCVVGSCGATCALDSECSCSEDSCVGRDYYDYPDVGDCLSAGNLACSCNQSACIATITQNDPRCGECDDDDDCNNLDREYCSEEIHMRDDGVCVNSMCEIDSSEVEDCGVKDGITGCGMFDWSCSEELNQVDCVITNIIANDSLCSDESSCNGEETCNNVTYQCEDGEAVDCSVFNIPGISSCFNIPDSNDLTFDFRTAFTSQCQDLQQGGFQCTTGNEDITHECDLECGAECSQDSDCENTECESGCHGDDYWQYSDVENDCDNCLCEQNQCGQPVILENDERCITCEPSAEICNGQDDDCDGLIDEHYIETNTSCGFSECARTGKMQCINGTEIDSCIVGTSSETEIDCDNQHDDDCDGLFDCEDSDCSQDEACDIECYDDSYCNPWPLQCMGNFCSDSDTVTQNVTRGKCELPGTVLSRCVVEWDTIIWDECYPGVCEGNFPNAQCVDNFCEENSDCGSNQLLNNYCIGNDLYSNYTSHVCNGMCDLEFNQVLNQTNSSLCLGSCSSVEDCPEGSSHVSCIAGNLVNTTRVPYCLSERCGFNEFNNTIGSCNNAPIVNLVSPAADYSTHSTSIGFMYNVTDQDVISSCSIKINGNVAETDSTITKDTNQMFTRSLSIGTYTWQISCYDGLNYGNSEIRSFKITEEADDDDDDDEDDDDDDSSSSRRLIIETTGCGNGICENDENSRTCARDCLESSYNLQGLGYQNYSVIDLTTGKKRTSFSWLWLLLILLLILLLLVLLLLLLGKKKNKDYY